MTGFITAVGINNALGQVDDFTGYETQGGNRILRLFDALIHPGRLSWPTIMVGLATIALIVWLQRTRLGALGMVIAIFAGSAVAGIANTAGWEILQVSDVADVPRSLPGPRLPVISDIPYLIVPALSLAFVGLVQGAGVSAGYPPEDGSLPDRSQDFVGQGAGNVLAGVFQGVPVGGSMSASSIAVTAGARSRAALIYAAAVMAIVILLFSTVVERIAMPSLAGLLIVVGVATVRPTKIAAVARTGTVPMAVMGITMVLTMIIPLQFSVMVGMGLSVLLFVIRQAGRLVTVRLVFRDDGGIEEVQPPDVLPAGEVVVLQPYGPIFFASAATLVEQLPNVTPESQHSVVILRIRGADVAGATLIDTLQNYASSLRDVGSRLMIVTNNRRVIVQLREASVTEAIGAENFYEGTALVGEAVRRAYDDALSWIKGQRRGNGAGTSGSGSSEAPTSCRSSQATATPTRWCCGSEWSVRRS